MESSSSEISYYDLFAEVASKVYIAPCINIIEICYYIQEKHSKESCLSFDKNWNMLRIKIGNNMHRLPKNNHHAAELEKKLQPGLQPVVPEVFHMFG